MRLNNAAVFIIPLKILYIILINSYLINSIPAYLYFNSPINTFKFIIIIYSFVFPTRYKLIYTLKKLNNL